MNHIIFVGMKKASKRNLHLLKRDMPKNESYHISSFRSLSPTNYRLLDTYLIVSYQKGEENCLLDVYILTRELYVFTRKDLYLCFGTCRQVVYEMFIFWI